VIHNTANVTALGAALNTTSNLNLGNFTTVINDDFTKDTSLNTNIWSSHWGNPNQYWFSGANGLLIAGHKSQGWNAVGIEQAPTGPSAGEGYGLYSFTGKASVVGQGVGICFVMWRADNVWLDKAHPGLLTELDMLESWDGTKTGQATDHYYNTATSQNGQLFHSVGNVDLNQFHTYSMDWENSSLTYYVDGRRMFQITGSSVPADFAHGGVNYTMGAEVVNEASGETTPDVGLYIKNISYSTPISSIVVPPPALTIAVSAPGTMQEASPGAGVTVTEGVVAAGLNTVYGAAYTASGAIEGGWQTVTLGSGGAGRFSVHLANSGDYVKVVDAVGTPTVTGTSSAVTITDPPANVPVSISGSGMTALLTAGESLLDTGSLNTLVLPASGAVTLNGNTTANGDLFDLRAAMATTNWGGNVADLGNYLTAATSNAGADLQVLLHATGDASSSVLATLTADGTDAGAFGHFQQHAILTMAPSGSAAAPVFISGPNVSVPLASGETLYDSGGQNTLVFASTGAVTLGGSGLSSDSFDLRAVMATTNWDGSSTTLGNYLTQGTAGTDLQLSLHPTGGSSASVFATLTGVGQQAGAFANFEQHAIF